MTIRCGHSSGLIPPVVILCLAMTVTARAKDKFNSAAFVAACRKPMADYPEIGRIACSCAADVIATRFTHEEVVALQGRPVHAFDDIHPGTTKQMSRCLRAAQASVKGGR